MIVHIFKKNVNDVAKSKTLILKWMDVILETPW